MLFIMKKGIHFFIAFLLLAVVVAQAQNISIGAKGGISIPNLSAGGNETPLNTGYTSRLGPDAALFAQFHISNAFSIQPMLEFSSQGGKKSGLQAFPTPAAAALYFQFQNQPVPDYLYGNYNSEVKLGYLMLPVLAKYELPLGNSPFHVYADAGPFASYLLSAKLATKGSSLIYTDAQGTQPLSGLGTFPFGYDTSVAGSFNKFNAGIEGHLGFSYTVSNLNFFVEGGGNYGFINVQKNEADGKNNVGAVVVMAGVSFRLGRGYD